MFNFFKKKTPDWILNQKIKTPSEIIDDINEHFGRGMIASKGIRLKAEHKPRVMAQAESDFLRCK